VSKTKIRTYRIDGDTLDVLFEFHEACGVWIGDYPFFDEEPRRTASGRWWRNVMNDTCPHATGRHGDCGTCTHLVREQPNDLIGVCYHESLRLLE